MKDTMAANPAMKRIVRLIIVFAALGVIVNIAVAWACGVWSDYDVTTWRHGSWSQSRLPNLERTPMAAWTVRGFGVQNAHIVPLALFEAPDHEPIEDVLNDWGLFTDLETLDTMANGQYLDFFSQGWPMHSLWCEYVENELQTHGGVWINGEFLSGTYYMAEHFIAFRPIWRGFIVNSLLYGAVMFLLFWPLTRARRWRRRRRGLCVRCAYPIGASDVCTECGAAITR